MMSLKAYTKKFEVASMKVTDDMTVREAREIERAKKSLWNFWQRWVEKTQEGTRNAPSNWVSLRIVRGNLKPTGYLTVEVVNGDPMSRGEVLFTFRLDKNLAWSQKVGA